jgi:hypothetical protein
MMTEELRKQKIQVLEGTIQRMNELAEGWRKERLAEGKDITNDISLGYSQMLITLIKGWVDSEKELLEIEGRYRDVIKTEAASAMRNAARRNRSGTAKPA